MTNQDARRILRNKPFLPDAGDTPQSYQNRLDAYAPQQSEDAAKAAEQAQKAERERQSAIKSVAQQDEKNTKSYLEDVYKPNRDALEKKKAEIEQAWEADKKAATPKLLGLIPGDPAAQARTQQHEKDWTDTQAQIQAWDSSPAAVAAKTAKIAAAAAAIEDVTYAKEKAKATGNAEDATAALNETVPKRITPQADPTYTAAYKEELARQGVTLPTPLAEGPTKEAAMRQNMRPATLVADNGTPPPPAQKPPGALELWLSKRRETQAAPLLSQQEKEAARGMSREQKKAFIEGKLTMRQGQLDEIDRNLQALGKDGQQLVKELGGLSQNDPGADNLLQATATAGTAIGRTMEKGFVETAAAPLYWLDALASPFVNKNPDKKASETTGTWFREWADNATDRFKDPDYIPLDYEETGPGQFAAQIGQQFALLPITAAVGAAAAATKIGAAASTAAANIAGRAFPWVGKSLAAKSAEEITRYGSGLIGAGVTGALTNGGMAYKDAIENGYTEKQAWQKWMASSGSGLLEMAGADSMLLRLNKFTRGTLGKTALAWAGEGVGEYLINELPQNLIDDYSDLLILPEGDPRRKSWEKIWTDAIEAGAQAALSATVMAMLFGTVARHDARRKLAKQTQVLDRLQSATAGMDQQQMYQQAAEILNAADPDVTAMRQRLTQIEQAITPSTLTTERETLEQERDAIQKQLASKLYTPEQIQIAADLANGQTSQFQENEARIASLREEITALRQSGEKFLNPTDYEALLEAQNDLETRLRKRASLFEAAVDALSAATFRSNLAIAREISAYPDTPADKNGNGIPQGNSQRDIAIAIHTLATTGVLNPAQANLIGANGKRIFSKPAKDGTITIENADTVESIKSTPLLNQAYANYIANPEAVRRSIQKQQSAPQNETPSSKSDPNATRKSQVPTTATGIYRVGAKSLITGEFAKQSFVEVRANSPKEALAKVTNGEIQTQTPPPNHQWEVSETIQEPQDAPTEDAQAPATEQDIQAAIKQAREATADIVRSLLPLFKGVTYIHDPQSQDAGMAYDTATGNLVINAANLDTADTEKMRRIAIEEAIHAALVTADIDAVGIWKAADEKTQAALMQAYASLREGSDFQRGHEFLRFYFQKKIDFTPDGRLLWDENGNLKTSEDYIPALIAKIRDAIAQIITYIDSILANTDTQAAKEITRARDTLKARLAQINRLNEALQQADTPQQATAPAQATPPAVPQANRTEQSPRKTQVQRTAPQPGPAIEGDHIEIGGIKIPTAGTWAAKDPRGPGIARGVIALVPLRLLRINTTLGANQDRINRDQTGAPQRQEIKANMTRENIPLAWNAGNSLIEGSPIADLTGSVLVGNNRAMTLLDLYTSEGERTKAADYEAWARQEVANYGLNPESFPNEPVVFLRIVTDTGGIPDLVKAANRAGTQEKTTAEKALADSPILDTLDPADRDATTTFYNAAGAGEDMRDSQGRADHDKIQARIQNALLAGMLRNAPEGAITATRLIDTQGRSWASDPFMAILRPVAATVRNLRSKNQSPIADAIGAFAQRLIQNQIAEKGDTDKALQRTAQQQEANLEPGSDTHTVQAIAQAFTDRTAYAITQRGNRKFDAETTSEQIADLLLDIQRAINAWSPEGDMLTGPEDIRQKIQAAIQRNTERNTLKSQAIPPHATLDQAAQLNGKQAFQHLTSQPAEQQSSRDRITRNPPSQRALDTQQQDGIRGPESDPARTAPLTGKSKAAFDAAIAQARPAFAALGSDISLSDQILPAGLGLSWARYSPAQKRAYFLPNSAPAAATPSLVRAYIREELIHAAQFAVAEREYLRDPKGAQSPEDYLARTHAAIARELAASTEGRQLLLASISAYRGGIAPEVRGTPEIAVAIAEKNPAYMWELARQLIQLRQQGNITEGRIRAAYNAVNAWFRKVLAVLKIAAQKSPSPLLDQAVQKTIDLLRGVDTGLLSSQPSPMPEDNRAPETSGQPSPGRVQTLYSQSASIKEASETIAQELSRILPHVKVTPTRTGSIWIAASDKITNGTPETTAGADDYTGVSVTISTKNGQVTANVSDINSAKRKSGMGRKMLEAISKAGVPIYHGTDWSGGFWMHIKKNYPELLNRPELRQQLGEAKWGIKQDGNGFRIINILTGESDIDGSLYDNEANAQEAALNYNQGYNSSRGKVFTSDMMPPLQRQSDDTTDQLSTLFSQRASTEEKAIAAGQILLDFAPATVGVPDIPTTKAATLTPEQQALVNDNLGIAYTIANKLAAKGYDREEIQQESTLGLARAALSYDPTRGAKFSTYAYRVIENHLHSVTRKLLRTKMRTATSLDEPIGDEPGTTRKDLVARDISIAEPDTEGLRILRRVTSTIPEKLRTVLEEFSTGATYEQIGTKRGISKQAIEQQLRKATALMRSRLEAAGIRSYADIFPDTGDAAPQILDTTRRQPTSTDPDPEATAQTEAEQGISQPEQEDTTLSSQGAFYSKLEQVIEAKMPTRASSDQIKGIINPEKGSGVKAEEIKWSGIIPWLESRKGATKQEVLEYLRNEGAVRFQEVTLDNITPEEKAEQDGIYERYRALTDEMASLRTRHEEGELTPSEASRELSRLSRERGELDDRLNKLKGRIQEHQTKYGQYQLPGGENYREVVLAMSRKDPAKVAMRKYGTTKLADLTDAQIDDINRESGIGAHSYTSSHFRDIPNYVAHMRLNEREDSEGKPGLFIEEIQSDRHQQGREKGYRGESKSKYTVEPDAAMPGMWIVKDKDGNTVNFGSTQQEAQKWADAYESENFGAIPDAPYRKEWPIAMFKRALRDAVESGRLWIGWTTGDTQADRYDLSKQVDEIRSTKNKTGNYVVHALKDGKIILQEQDVPAAKLPDLVGKDLADKIIEQVTDEAPSDATDYDAWHSFTGQDLKVGGEGMKGFYDQILPKEIAKYVKQWGAKVEKGAIHNEDSANPEARGIGSDGSNYWVATSSIAGERLSQNYATYGEADDARARMYRGETPIWRVNITPAMRQGVQQGQALFSQKTDGKVETFPAGPEFMGLEYPDDQREAREKERDAHEQKLISWMESVFPRPITFLDGPDQFRVVTPQPNKPESPRITTFVREQVPDLEPQDLIQREVLMNKRRSGQNLTEEEWSFLEKTASAPRNEAISPIGHYEYQTIRKMVEDFHNRLPDSPATTEMLFSQAPDRTYESIQFNPPFAAPFGDILSYHWLNRAKGDSGRAVSDWSSAKTNPITQRKIVHLFRVQRSNGDIGSVSLETAMGQLTKQNQSQLRNRIASEMQRQADQRAGQMTLFSQNPAPSEPWTVVTPEQAQAELGRAQPLDALVLTPTGYLPLGHTFPGQSIVDPATGTATRIVDVYPQGDMDIYEIELEDGSIAHASEDHLWVARGYAHPIHTHSLTTEHALPSIA